MKVPEDERIDELQSRDADSSLSKNPNETIFESSSLNLLILQEK